MPLKPILRISVFDFWKLSDAEYSQTIADPLVTLDEILEIADKTKESSHLSMGFGNPYGDPWDVEIVGDWTEKLSWAWKFLSLSDTVGNSTSMNQLFVLQFDSTIPRNWVCLFAYQINGSRK
jgi:hypothetical protein